MGERPTPQEVRDVLADWWFRTDYCNQPEPFAVPVSVSILDALAAAGYRVMPEPDEDTRREVKALIADQTPHICVHCKGAGWVDDEGWSHYGDGWGGRGSPPLERSEGDGLVPCGVCGDWDTYRDERTEPTLVVDGWSREQEASAADLLDRYVLGRDA